MNNKFDSILLATVEKARIPESPLGDFGLDTIEYAQVQGKRAETPVQNKSSSSYVREPRKPWWDD